MLQDKEPPVHVVFVDDDAYVLNGIRRMFGQLNVPWEVDYFTDPRAALQHIQHHPCDVVVSDISMPGMNGFALMESVRVGNPAALCILLSGATQEAERLYCRQRGYPLLEKPYTAEDLQAAIAAALQHSRKGPEGMMPEQRQRTLLIVDDDALFRAGTRRLLWLVKDQLPLDIIEAGDGVEAFQQLTDRKIDCILLDNRMPHGLGIEWIPKFLAAAPDVAVVMITGAGDERTAVEAMKKGAMDYLVKGSVTAGGLHRAITNALEKSELRLALERQRAALAGAAQQKVLIEDLATACQQIGHPATVVYAYLQMMVKWDLSPEHKKVIHECLAATESIADGIHRLQEISELRTVLRPVSTDSDGPKREIQAGSLRSGNGDAAPSGKAIRLVSDSSR